MTELPKKYNPKEAEPRLESMWENAGTYHFQDDKPKAETFVIDTPPPTVSGMLHMGHVFSYTQADFIARYKRMQGYDVFYPMGFDDNGLPTERLVEKTKKIQAHRYIQEHGREAFVALCREVVVDAENDFRSLFKRIALSVDWNQEYQTISDEVRALSQASFIDLYQKGEVYRDFRPTYWDWKDQTAIATAEIEEQELPGIQCTIPFGIMDACEWRKLKDGNAPRPAFETLEKVNIMTTRPELLGACVGLMCHPDDKAQYEGKVAVTPLFNVVVPICFDEKVDKEKGTGFVMCCSWGDDTDKEWIAEHGLAWRPLTLPTGKLGLGGTSRNGETEMNGFFFEAGRDGTHGGESAITHRNCLDFSKAYALFQQLEGTKLIRDIKNENSAKGRALQLLEEAGLLLPQGEKSELIIHKTQTVKCAERSGAPIEIIPTYQWFIRIKDKQEAFLAKGAKCEWHPPFMRTRLNQWIEGLKDDWCISRQRFFGVPFPVWLSRREGEEGKILTADIEQLPVDPMVTLPEGYTQEEVHAVTDVMDTWATSSITPQINARGKQDPLLAIRNPQDKLFPADIRPQAHEIIRTWAFYTIVKAHLHSDSIPWEHLMISGWVLAADKTKMSKSKGNVVTPEGLIEDKGADVVRYWASTAKLGADTAYSEDVLKIGHKLVNKIWNASKFVEMQLQHLHGEPGTAYMDIERGAIYETLDIWILSRLHEVIHDATESFNKLEYADARACIEQFFWKDFCDNYLELVKTRAYDPEGHNKVAQQSALYTLHHTLKALLQLFAPFLPHITEEIYQHLFAQTSVHARNSWPNAGDYPLNTHAITSGKACVSVLEAVRKVKAAANVSIKYPVHNIHIQAESQEASWELIEPVQEDLKAAAGADVIAWLEITDQPMVTDDGLFKVQIVLADEKQEASGT